MKMIEYHPIQKLNQIKKKNKLQNKKFKVYYYLLVKLSYPDNSESPSLKVERLSSSFSYYDYYRVVLIF